MDTDSVKSIEAPTVFIVEDDPQGAESLALLVASIGLQYECYSSADDFLAHYHPARPGCLVLDVRMRGMSGMELYRRLASERNAMPIVLIAAYAEVSMGVEALRTGAFDFFEKPYSPQTLLERIQEALRQDARFRAQQAQRERVAALRTGLSDREREVMDLLVQGNTSKETAATLDISGKTVDFHRRNILEKMGVSNVIELARLLDFTAYCPGRASG